VARNLCFVFATELRNLGSTVMRGAELSEIARSFLTEFSVHLRSSDADLSNSILFLTKGVLKTSSVEQFEQWRRRGNVLLVDLVDEDCPEALVELADVVVAASVTALREQSIRYPHKRVELINHHVSPRIVNHPGLADPFRSASPRIAYFGETGNTFMPRGVKKRVDVIPIDTGRAEYAWVDRLMDYNIHYAVRRRRRGDLHKPFLKGFVAAYAGANIIIQSSDCEAVHWLGEDYPYLIDGEASRRGVLAMIDQVCDDHGSGDWFRGLARMEELRAAVSFQRIARELSDVLSGIWE
jgi:hypothetical protein